MVYTQSMIQLGFLLILWLASSTAISAQDWHDTASIEAEVETFVKSQLDPQPDQTYQVTLSAVDKRLQLSRCPEPLSLSFPGSIQVSRYTTVKVSCKSETPWTIYVSTQVKAMHAVVVAKTALAPGVKIDASMLEQEWVDVHLSHGALIKNAEQIIGSKVKRHVAAGRPLRMSNLCIVCKGDPVNIVASDGAFMIRTRGTALSDGSLGESIRIQNNRSGRTISALVKRVGEVWVTL